MTRLCARYRRLDACESNLAEIKRIDEGIDHTGLSSLIQSSRHSGSSVA